MQQHGLAYDNIKPAYSGFVKPPVFSPHPKATHIKNKPV